ncbi:hypothetical protein O6H91_05G020000 [Diphasiastrum complanatum]|uniref:Uncharacterized protein n=2 Tax=Diphasiastrum complanatum TaxID=34168 RepID=A0ACC2DLE7_DIPCM|nr:hypothetical protein O6H91_05G020000 [Diphasiastrum complanatum]
MPEVQTIVMKVGMHCDGCARKVRKILTHMAGVEELKVDYPGQRVTVKGTIDPKKVVHKVSKAGKAVEILEIIAEPPKPAEDAGAEPPKEAPPPEVKTIILRVMMHCEGCARKVKDVLRKIPGVQEVNVDFKEQKVTVKGNMDANTVLQKASKTGKQVELWPAPPEEPKDVPKEESKEAPIEEKKDGPPEENKDASKKEETETPTEEKKDEPKEETKDTPQENVVGEDQKKEEAKGDTNELPKEENKDAPKEGDGTKEEKKDIVEEEKKEAKAEDKDVSKQDSNEEKKDEYKDEVKYFIEDVTSSYIVYRCDAPQIFSDDNPNACTIM